MKSSTIVAVLLAGAVMLPACKSKNSPDPAKSIKKPDPAPDDDPEPKVDPKPAKPDAAAIIGAPLAPKEIPPGVTIDMVNRSGGDFFIPPGRSFFDVLSLERHAGGKWVPISYRLGTCGQMCPADGSKPTCQPCLPSRPLAGRLPNGANLAHTWYSTLLYERTISKKCWCSFSRKAPTGRYRATACFFPGAQVDLTPAQLAKKTVHTMNRMAMTGKKICKSVEFELEGKAIKVKIVFDKR
jgi:hypothetical protein